jgi:SagB-type dehydrogenase family enzyme
LHAAYGVTDFYDAQEAPTPREPSGNGAGLPPRPPRRSVPSGGALYPLEIYPAVRNVDGLASGLYHYDPLKHALEVIREEDLDDRLRALLVRRPELPDSAGSCGVVVFIAGIFWRTRFKYAVRGYRLALLEAGHVAQNMLLVAEALGLSAYPNVAFWDRQVDGFLGLDGVNESVFYSVLAGSR